MLIRVSRNVSLWVRVKSNYNIALISHKRAFAFIQSAANTQSPINACLGSQARAVVARAREHHSRCAVIQPPRNHTLVLCVSDHHLSATGAADRQAIEHRAQRTKSVFGGALPLSSRDT